MRDSEERVRRGQKWQRMALVCVAGVFFGGIGAEGSSIPQGIESYKSYFESVVDAIYWAEGGPKASVPYGILSIPCEGVSCRRIAYNTVRNNFARFIRNPRGHAVFLDFLSSRYAPVGCSNDNGTNRHWKRNVEFFINNPKEVPR